MNTIIIGATSGIAIALAEAITTTSKGHNTLLLAGRNTERLEKVAAHLQGLGAHHIKIQKTRPGEPLSQQAQEMLQEVPQCTLVVIAQGTLPKTTTEQSIAACLQVNACEPIQWCHAFSTLWAKTSSGNKPRTIAVMGSIAGDRGRASNHLYGASKSALATYCQGLQHALAKQPGNTTRICLIKPGPTKTAMTAHMAQGATFCSPERVAADTLAAIQKEQACCYTPWVWKPIMGLIKSLPDKIFWRTNL
jgi:decaprenylphospho-beta-D-erythro-pentofuranosid-2-ulose 2-reductase